MDWEKADKRTYRKYELAYQAMKNLAHYNGGRVDEIERLLWILSEDLDEFIREAGEWRHEC